MHNLTEVTEKARTGQRKITHRRTHYLQLVTLKWLSHVKFSLEKIRRAEGTSSKEKEGKKEMGLTGGNELPPRPLISSVCPPPPVRKKPLAGDSPSSRGRCLYVHGRLLSCQKSEHGCRHGFHVDLAVRQGGKKKNTVKRPNT